MSRIATTSPHQLHQYSQRLHDILPSQWAPTATLLRPHSQTRLHWVCTHPRRRRHRRTAGAYTRPIFCLLLQRATLSASSTNSSSAAKAASTSSSTSASSHPRLTSQLQKAPHSHCTNTSPCLPLSPSSAASSSSPATLAGASSSRTPTASPSATFSTALGTP